MFALIVALGIFVGVCVVIVYASQIYYILDEMKSSRGQFKTKKQLHLWLIPLYPIFAIFKDTLVKCIKTYKDLK